MPQSKRGGGATHLVAGRRPLASGAMVRLVLTSLGKRRGCTPQPAAAALVWKGIRVRACTVWDSLLPVGLKDVRRRGRARVRAV